jgi:hypothetical protein
MAPHDNSQHAIKPAAHPSLPYDKIAKSSGVQEK